MSSRKHTPPPSLWTQRDKYCKFKDTHFTFTNNPHLKYPLVLLLFFSIWSLLLFFLPPKTTSAPVHKTKFLYNGLNLSTKPLLPTCNKSLSVYVYELPEEFNYGLLKDCQHLNMYTDMCPHVANSGLGRPLPSMGSTSWFATNQFTSEMIFHARLMHHPCRTSEPARANMFYVPFYGGLHASSKFREPNFTARDGLTIRLVEYIQSQPWWLRHNGNDHFMALGRTAWDFMRTTTGPDYGASCLLNLSPVKNMSVLIVERNPWDGSNQHGLPYPSYFHPSTWNEMLMWQQTIQGTERTHLFSFIGGPRKGVEKAAIRDEIIKQCRDSNRCNLLKCGKGASNCYNPEEVIKVMSRSQFCLQAPGDSFTRRSTFDSVLAGCIPVFFSLHTAYSQYAWFLPSDTNAYSVYINSDGNASKSIEQELLKIPADTIERMRSTVIDLIPSLTYMHPNSTDYKFRDAVDVALEALSKHINAKLHLQM